MKNLRLTFIIFILFSVIASSQNASLLATSSQEEEKEVSQLATPQANKLHAQYALRTITIVLQLLNIVLYWKKVYYPSWNFTAFAFSYLFLNCFAYHQHLNGALFSEKKPISYSIIEAILLVLNFVFNVILINRGEPYPGFIIALLIFIFLPLIYLVLDTVKQYKYATQSATNKTIFSKIKSCLAKVSIEWACLIAGYICFWVSYNIQEALLVLSLSTLFSIKENSHLFKGQPGWYITFDIVELLFLGISGILIKSNTLGYMVTFASIWVILKNAVVMLLHLIQKVPEEDKALNINS